MFVWLREGGGFTWLLLGLSVVAVAFILERAWALRRSRVIPPNLERLLGVAEPDALRGACAAQPSPLANLVVSVLDHAHWSKGENVAALEVGESGKR